jgi:hypothetical protein
VKYEDMVSDAGQPGLELVGITSYSGDLTQGETFVIDDVVGPSGEGGWTMLQNLSWVVPDNINELAFQLTVTPHVTAGTAWWTYARIVPADTPLAPQ